MGALGITDNPVESCGTASCAIDWQLGLVVIYQIVTRLITLSLSPSALQGICGSSFPLKMSSLSISKSFPIRTDIPKPNHAPTPEIAPCLILHSDTQWYPRPNEYYRQR